jgi:hypothetical protein
LPFRERRLGRLKLGPEMIPALTDSAPLAAVIAGSLSAQISHAAADAAARSISASKSNRCPHSALSAARPAC